MTRSRRELLASLAAIPSFSVLKSLDPPETAPLSSIEPIETKHHTVSRITSRDMYSISMTWIPYKIHDFKDVVFTVPTPYLENRVQESLRNPFQMYRESIQSKELKRLTDGIEQSVSSLAFTNALNDGETKHPRLTNADRKIDTDGDREVKKRTQFIRVERDQRKQIASHEIEHSIREEKNNSTRSQIETTTTGRTLSFQAPKSVQEDGLKSSDWKDYVVPQLVRFVQEIKYKQDFKRDMPIDYPQYPIETLYFGVADCEDTSILLATLLEQLHTIDSIRTALVVPPGHMAVLAAIPDLPNSSRYTEYTTIDGVPYTYFETTTDTEIFGTPDIVSEDHLFIYQNGEYKDVNAGILPAAVRESVQIGKKGIMSFFDI